VLPALSFLRKPGMKNDSYTPLRFLRGAPHNQFGEAGITFNAVAEDGEHIDPAPKCGNVRGVSDLLASDALQETVTGLLLHHQQALLRHVQTRLRHVDMLPEKVQGAF
jgi:hypothetical protein